MLVDLKSAGKRVVVVGGGSEGYRKTVDFVEAGALVHVVSCTFSAEIKKLNEAGKVTLQETMVKDVEAFVKGLAPEPDVLVAVTDDHELNLRLIRSAKSAGCMVYAPDNPALSDFILPATAKVGDVKIAISTDGKSPAMAHVLRERIEKLITEEDLLQVKLQSHLRETLKRQVPDQKTRRKLLYAVLEDAQVKELVKEGKLGEAQAAAKKIIAQAAEKAPVQSHRRNNP